MPKPVCIVQCHCFTKQSGKAGLNIWGNLKVQIWIKLHSYMFWLLVIVVFLLSVIINKADCGHFPKIVSLHKFWTVISNIKWHFRNLYFLFIFLIYFSISGICFPAILFENLTLLPFSTLLHFSYSILSAKGKGNWQK